MTCDVIATGSQGNAVLLNGQYLFDCGVPMKTLKNYAKHLRVVFLTHIHGDHFKKATIYRLHRNYPRLMFVCGRNLLVPLCTECGVSPDNVVLAEPGKPAAIHFWSESIHIEMFDLVHNVENVGYSVRVTGGEEPGTALYATDTQYIPVSAPGLDLYMVECNYHIDALRERRRRKAEMGGFIYEDTVEVSHMSAETVNAWLAANAGKESQVVFLHQHREQEVAEIG